MTLSALAKHKVLSILCKKKIAFSFLRRLYWRLITFFSLFCYYIRLNKFVNFISFKTDFSIILIWFFELTRKQAAPPQRWGSDMPWGCCPLCPPPSYTLVYKFHNSFDFSNVITSYIHSLGLRYLDCNVCFLRFECRKSKKIT